MTKKELVKLLVDNFKDEVGNLDLSGLDFTNEDLNCVIISEMKVNRHLFQNRQQVQGSLWQDEQEVSGSIWQSNQTVKGNLYQNRQQVKRELWQGNQKVEGDLRQDYQEVKEICIIKNKMTKAQEPPFSLAFHPRVLRANQTIQQRPTLFSANLRKNQVCRFLLGIHNFPPLKYHHFG